MFKPTAADRKLLDRADRYPTFGTAYMYRDGVVLWTYRTGVLEAYHLWRSEIPFHCHPAKGMLPEGVQICDIHPCVVVHHPNHLRYGVRELWLDWGSHTRAEEPHGIASHSITIVTLDRVRIRDDSTYVNGTCVRSGSMNLFPNPWEFLGSTCRDWRAVRTAVEHWEQLQYDRATTLIDHTPPAAGQTSAA